MIKVTDSQLNLLDHARQTKTPKVLCVCAAGMVENKSLKEKIGNHSEVWLTKEGKTYMVIDLTEYKVPNNSSLPARFRNVYKVELQEVPQSFFFTGIITAETVDGKNIVRLTVDEYSEIGDRQADLLLREV